MKKAYAIFAVTLAVCTFVMVGSRRPHVMAASTQIPVRADGPMRIMDQSKVPHPDSLPRNSTVIASKGVHPMIYPPQQCYLSLVNPSGTATFVSSGPGVDYYTVSYTYSASCSTGYTGGCGWYDHMDYYAWINGGWQWQWAYCQAENLGCAATNNTQQYTVGNFPVYKGYSAMIVMTSYYGSYCGDPNASRIQQAYVGFWPQ